MKVTKGRIRQYRAFAFLAVGNVICYIIRFSINVAILEMTDSQPTTLEAVGSCRNSSTVLVYDLPSSMIRSNDKIVKYNWNEKEQGCLISSFFYGYMASTMLIGMTDIIKPSTLLALGIGGSGSLLIVFKLFADLGLKWVIVLRVLQGVCQGGFLPSQTAMWGRIASENQRTILSGITISMCLCGNMVSNALTGFLCTMYSWEYTYCIYGLVSIVWTIFWILCNRDVAETEVQTFPYGVCKPNITPDDETSLLKNSSSDANLLEVSESGIPWARLLKSQHFWVATYGHLCYGILANVMIVALPKYIYQVHGLTTSVNGFITSLPFLSQIITSILACIVVDHIRSTRLVNITRLRKYCAALCLLPGSVLLLFLPSCGCNLNLIICLICFTTAFMGFNSAAFIPSYIDISPKYSGVLHSIANVLFATEGFLVPHVLGFIISSDPYGTDGWAPLWFLCAIISATGALVFIVFGNSEAMTWPNEWRIEANCDAPYGSTLTETHETPKTHETQELKLMKYNSEEF